MRQAIIRDVVFGHGNHCSGFGYAVVDRSAGVVVVSAARETPWIVIVRSCVCMCRAAEVERSACRRTASINTRHSTRGCV